MSLWTPASMMMTSPLDECSKQDIHFANATIVEDPLTPAFNSDYRRRAAMTTNNPEIPMSSASDQ
jgi:hypothetical protein